MGRAVVDGGTNLRAAGATAPVGELDRVEEWMDMLARAGTIGCTRFTAAPLTCPPFRVTTLTTPKNALLP